MAAVSVVQYVEERRLVNTEDLTGSGINNHTSEEKLHNQSSSDDKDEQGNPENDEASEGVSKPDGMEETQESGGLTECIPSNGKEKGKKSKGFYKRFLRAWRRKLPTKEANVQSSDPSSATSCKRKTEDDDEEDDSEELANIAEDNEPKEDEQLKTESDAAMPGKENNGESPAKMQTEKINITKKQSNQKLTKQASIDSPKERSASEHQEESQNGNDKKSKKGQKLSFKSNETTKKTKDKIAKQESLPAEKHKVKRKPRRAFSLGSADNKRRQLRHQQTEASEGIETKLDRCNSNQDLSEQSSKPKHSWFSVRITKLRQRSKQSDSVEPEPESPQEDSTKHLTNGETTSEGNLIKTEDGVHQERAVDIFEPRITPDLSTPCNLDDTPAASHDHCDGITPKRCQCETDAETTLLDNNDRSSVEMSSQPISNNDNV